MDDGFGKNRLGQKRPCADIGPDVVNHFGRCPVSQKLQQLEGIDVTELQPRRDSTAQSRETAPPGTCDREALAKQPRVIKQGEAHSA